MNIISVDVGQSVDPTALVVWTDVKRLSDKKNPPGTPAFFEEVRDIKTSWACRLIERLPLGTLYQTICDRVYTISDKLPGHTHLLVDATGVGRPVIEMMRSTKLNPIGIIITGGKETTQTDIGWNVPKQDLVSSLMILYQTGQIKVAAGLELAPVLVREMMSFTAKVSPKGNASYEAHRANEHDDIVLAMAQAAWYVRKYFPATESQTIKEEYDAYETLKDWRR
jgi:hypothetical protein